MAETSELIAPEAPATSGENAAAAPQEPGGSLMDQLRSTPSQPVSSSATTSDAAPNESGADRPAPETASNPDPAPEARSAPAPATPATPPPFDPATVLTGEAADAAVVHQTGGRFKTAVELTAALADPTTLLPESQRALLAHVQAGGKLSEIGAVLDTDWDAAKDLDVHRAAWDKANPQYTDPELREFAWDKHVNDKFANALSDDDADAAVKYDKLQLKQLADADRAAFKADQDRLRTLPTAANAAAEEARQQAAEDAALLAWAQSADAAATETKSLTLTYDTPTGEQTATLDLADLSEDERRAVKDPITELGWMRPDGSWDAKKVAADTLTLKRQKAANSLLFDQGRVAERAEQFARLQNRSENPNNQTSGAASLAEQLKSPSTLHRG